MIEDLRIGVSIQDLNIQQFLILDKSSLRENILFCSEFSIARHDIYKWYNIICLYSLKNWGLLRQMYWDYQCLVHQILSPWQWAVYPKHQALMWCNNFLYWLACGYLLRAIAACFCSAPPLGYSWDRCSSHKKCDTCMPSSSPDHFNSHSSIKEYFVLISFHFSLFS